MLLENREEFLNVVFCILLPRPFDMTLGQVSDPGSSGELGEINVHFFWRRVYCVKCFWFDGPNKTMSAQWLVDG